MAGAAKLPVHGFVLAGGKSSRMGRDKALLPFGGRTMLAIALEKLRGFCADVAIGGNREDLMEFAPVIREARRETGPGAGLEAGLLACRQPWALFLPVDVPLVPEPLLQAWAEAVLERSAAGCAASFLLVRGERQPAFCMLRRSAAEDVTRALDRGERRLDTLLYAVDDAAHGWVWAAQAEAFAPETMDPELAVRFWFSNVNTPEELAEAELWAGGAGRLIRGGLRY